MRTHSQHQGSCRVGLWLSLGLLCSACESEPSAATSSGSSGTVDEDDVTTRTASDDGDDPDPSRGDGTSSGTSPDPDDTGQCEGCVDGSGACQPGTSDEACGAFGESCLTCSDGLQCAEGVCLSPPACGPENCDGCCDGDQCLDGTTAVACGGSGVQCSTCPDGGDCNQGVCDVPCALSCDGCCTEDDTCIPAKEQDANVCGADAAACIACAGGFECVAGACISTSCAETCDGCCDGATCLTGGSDDACGSGGGTCSTCSQNLSCVDATCEPDLDAQWDVVVIQAVVSSTDVDGDAWDVFNGLPDPYVVMEVAGMSGESSVLDDELFPEWNETILTGVTTLQLSDGFEIAIADSDFGLDTTMCGSSLEVTASTFDPPVVINCTINGFEVWAMAFELVPTL